MRTLSEPAMELRIRAVSKIYSNGVQALKGVTLTIPVGMYGLLGPNGAGKSTLMRMIATLQEPDAGSIRLSDIDVLSQKDETLRLLSHTDAPGQAGYMISPSRSRRPSAVEGLLPEGSGQSS